MKFLSTLFFCGLLASAHAAPLPRPVVKALQQAHIPLSSVGIEVREIKTRTPLISVHSNNAMNPASTMKLLTTYAGLELLGPAHTWKTEAYLNGQMEQGVLHGDLILKGYGDPKFTVEQFWLWLRELRSRGLREIQGNLVLDRSAFEPVPHDPAVFDNEPIRPYNVGSDALLLNFNAVHLRFIPDGEQIRVISEPELAGIKLDNRITPASAAADANVLASCSNWNDTVSAQLQDDTILLQGSFPAQCGECEQNVCLIPPPRYLYSVFRALWQEMGGTLQGEMVEGGVPASATFFSVHHSQPLGELIRDINKFSNNVMARQLFLSLGGNEEPASVARSKLVLYKWLAQKKLNFPELVLENGAGLSRYERISPHNLALLLQSAQHSPFAAEFTASLPIAGVDGTLKKRLNGSAMLNQAHLKTGSLEGIKSVAGYVQSRSGKQWVMVFLINHANAAAGQPAQDALIEWLQRQ
ncbi:MAG: D-alanyl-D-alanine carboxypeptidase/D-alanyl-D-alanine-endopeptidase [Gallionellaceae bacterium]|nr:D-alanyl-D-alanine carboxypeptidase/D-alanyl-D-alanine-endopeptidase [Gallionellaceae bacterium]